MASFATLQLMKISVVIPVYNGETTIRETLDSVLRQSVQPDEILVFNDGSTDDTGAILRSYRDTIRVFTGPNNGVARARNFLCEKTKGDAIALLDADDLWHPRYLELQIQLLSKYPAAVAGITYHSPFRNNDRPTWSEFPEDIAKQSSLMKPVDFLGTYNRMVVNFMPSFCCLPRRTLTQMGRDPFPGELKGTDDYFMLCTLALYGPVACFRQPFGAYRLTPNSISSNRVRIIGEMLHADRLLAERTTIARDTILSRPYHIASASLRRRYGKHLMGAGNPTEARKQIWTAMQVPAGSRSRVKSVGLYVATLLPRFMQPEWPRPNRD